MTTLQVRGEIDPDGTLRLAVPMNLPPGPAEVLIVVQPDAGPSPRPPASARSGLFTRTPESDALDVDAVRRQINAGWQTRLDLHPY